jgi:Zn-finger nucleic acid-binding protein
MDHCPSCGAKADRAADRDAPSLPCPECKASMHGLRVGATPMHECTGCNGQWLEASIFTQLCNSREERGAVTSFAAVTRLPARPRSAPTDRVHYLPCPVCRKIMNRQNFGRRSGVILDVCRGDGAWFQSGELHAALAFIDSGGFEAARQADELRRIEEQVKLQKEYDAAGRLWRQLDVHDQAVRHDRLSPDGLDATLRTLFFNI